MKVIRAAGAEKYEPEKGWKRVSLCSEENISVEHFVKPPHHASPMHSHPNTQVLIALKGRLAIVNDANLELFLEEGDAVYIPANEPHLVKNPLDTAAIGLDIFVPGRSFDFWLKKKTA